MENFERKDRKDFNANLFFRARNCRNMKYTTKIVDVDGEQTILVNVGGVNADTGEILDVDLWPRNSATQEDLDSLPEKVDNIEFRIGYHEKEDHTVVVSRVPKWVTLIVNGVEFKLNGEKREYKG